MESDMHNEQVKKDGVKVYLSTTDSRYFEGFVFLEPEQRLQDILNEDRQFLPIHIIDPDKIEYVVMQINKNNIQRIEEADQIEQSVFSEHLLKSVRQVRI